MAITAVSLDFIETAMTWEYAFFSDPCRCVSWCCQRGISTLNGCRVKMCPSESIIWNSYGKNPLCSSFTADFLVRFFNPTLTLTEHLGQKSWFLQFLPGKITIFCWKSSLQPQLLQGTKMWTEPPVSCTIEDYPETIQYNSSFWAQFNSMLRSISNTNPM